MHTYRTIDGKRTRLRHIGPEPAQLAFGRLRPKESIFAITDGQLSFVDVLHWILDQTGPADLDIATWTSGLADGRHLDMLVSRGMIRRARWLLDTSFRSRFPKIYTVIENAFGASAICESSNHAKFAAISNDSWNVVVRTSMNLNQNKRIETLSIDDHAGLCRHIREFMDGLLSDVVTPERSRSLF